MPFHNLLLGLAFFHDLSCFRADTEHVLDMPFWIFSPINFDTEHILDMHSWNFLLFQHACKSHIAAWIVTEHIWRLLLELLIPWLHPRITHHASGFVRAPWRNIEALSCICISHDSHHTPWHHCLKHPGFLVSTPTGWLLLASSEVMVKSLMSLARSETLAKDRLVTRAISKYVQIYRDSLLQELPKELRKDKITTRNELCRLARRKFRAEPKEVQEAFLSRIKLESIMADPGEPRLSGGQVVDTKMHTEVTNVVLQPEAVHPEEPGLSGGQVVDTKMHTEMTNVTLQPKAVHPGELALSGDQVVDTKMHTEMTNVVLQPEAVPTQEGASGDSWNFDIKDLENALLRSAPANAGLVKKQAEGDQANDALVESMTEVVAHQPAKDAPLRHMIAKHVPWLCEKFGCPVGAEVLASALRFSSDSDKLDKSLSETVLCAAVMGLAVKATVTNCSSEDLKQVWQHVGCEAEVHDIKMAELKLLQAWALIGCEGGRF